MPEMKLKADLALEKLLNEYNWKNISISYSQLYNSLLKNA
jgi:hypothetical protein